MARQTDKLATYQQVKSKGKHVVCMPVNNFLLQEENYDWFVYAAPMDTYSNPTDTLTLFWVNHTTGECVRYGGYDRVIDPTNYPYSMLETTRGRQLRDAREEKRYMLKYSAESLDSASL